MLLNCCIMDPTVIMVGATFAGKSGFLENSTESITTVAMNYYKRDKLRIWELSGHIAYRRIITLYMKMKTDAFIIMFNNANSNTFNEVEQIWLPLVLPYKKPIYLFENSFYGSRVVPIEKIQTIVSKYNLKHMMVSPICLQDVYNELTCCKN